MRFKRIILPLCLSVLLCCSKEEAEQTYVDVNVLFNLGAPSVKSQDPRDEAGIADLNLMLYNSASGRLESHIWMDRRVFGTQPITLSLLKGVSYDIVACLNFGFKLTGVQTRDELRVLRYYMAYPDEYSGGMPILACKTNYLADERDITLEAERLMAKVIISINRSDLDKGVKMAVTKATISGCPRSVALFEDSRPLGEDDVFRVGFTKEGTFVDDLNRDAGGGLSKEVCLYMLENMSGNQEKTVDGPPGITVPYLELSISYNSPTTYSLPGEALIYRFILGEKDGEANMRRNHLYRFTITPHGDGLSGEGSWSVDASALANYP